MIKMETPLKHELPGGYYRQAPKKAQSHPFYI